MRSTPRPNVPQQGEIPLTEEREENTRRSGSRSGGGRRRGYGRRGPRLCQFCSEKVRSMDYKQVDMLKRYVTEQGKIRSRRETGTCARHQRMLARTVKRARHMALLPFAADRFR
jgi:small subunit ribosomal protein S18